MGKGNIVGGWEDSNLVYPVNLYPVKFTIVTACPVAPEDGTGADLTGVACPMKCSVYFIGV